MLVFHSQSPEENLTTDTAIPESGATQKLEALATVHAALAIRLRGVVRNMS
jgi:hypothetical protein